jgi:hypothetical protein
MKGKIRSKGEMAPREGKKFVQQRSVVGLKENEGLRKGCNSKKEKKRCSDEWKRYNIAEQNYIVGRIKTEITELLPKGNSSSQKSMKGRRMNDSVRELY